MQEDTLVISEWMINDYYFFLQKMFEPTIDLLWGGSVGTVVSEVASVVGKSVHS